MNCPTCLTPLTDCPENDDGHQVCACPGNTHCPLKQQHWLGSSRAENLPEPIDFTEPVRQKRQGWAHRT